MKNRPEWLIKCNKAAKVIMILLVIYIIGMGAYFDICVFNGFTGFFVIDFLMIFALLVLPFLTVFIFPPSLIAFLFVAGVAAANKVYDKKSGDSQQYM